MAAPDTVHVQMADDNFEQRKRALEEAELRQRERQLEVSKGVSQMKQGCAMILAVPMLIVGLIMAVLALTLLWSILTAH